MAIPVRRCTRSHIGGYRRRWREPYHAGGRAFVGLAVEPGAAGDQVDGVLLELDAGDLPYIQEREKTYRHINVDARRDDSGTVSAITFQGLQEPTPDALIPFSYLAVVLAGFEQEFGADGPRQFVENTAGWEHHVYMDLVDPMYVRAPPNLEQLAADYVGLIERVTTLVAEA